MLRCMRITVWKITPEQFSRSGKKILIDTHTYTIELAAYIHNNPVVAHLAKSSNNWKFSDCKKWMGEKPFRFEGKSLLECYFTDTKEYANFFNKYQEETEQANAKICWMRCKL